MSAQPPYPPRFPSAQQPPAAAAAGSVLARLAARLIDGLIVGIPVGLVLGIALGVLQVFLGVLAAFVLSATSIAALLGYYVYFESTRGATIGKRVMGLRTLGPTGANPTAEEALGRNLFNVALFLGWIPAVGSLLNLFGLASVIAVAVTISTDPLGRGWHDKIAGGTRVIKVG